MISVSVLYEQEQIKHMIVEGHALFDEAGKDIVCAGVSSVVIGLLNALDQKSDYELQVDDESSTITINAKNVSDVGQLICEVGLIQLQTIANEFPKNINIREVKV